MEQSSGSRLVDDFTNAITKAYGNNMINVDTSPVRFGIFSGDVNQDKAIDLSDVLSVYNAAISFTTGYAVNDVTGDNTVDLADLLIAYNNSVAFVVVKRP